VDLYQCGFILSLILYGNKQINTRYSNLFSFSFYFHFSQTKSKRQTIRRQKTTNEIKINTILYIGREYNLTGILLTNFSSFLPSFSYFLPLLYVWRGSFQFLPMMEGAPLHYYSRYMYRYVYVCSICIGMYMFVGVCDV
jgi:hypothetical protein